ncbi:MAG TPA: hypothetical protein VGR82_13585 [Methylomirabilota bacterium]|jgi:hypothetical protein|nr:hypothetical protein [Methylomirabilota bacterium]
MAREIFIVAQDRPDLYRYLSQTFGDAENVQVIWDRRNGDRRTLTAARKTRERRGGDRRGRASVEHDLRTVGYAFITIP